MNVPSRPETASSAAPRRRSRRRGLLVLAAIAVVFALVGASCKQLDPKNRAAAVPGVTNGNLPMSYLASTGQGCAVYDESLASLKAMIVAAAKDGVTLKPLSCYRDYAGQVAARNDWCGRGACQMAAVPGTSNHGWGKAIDFRDQSGELTFDSVGYQWMKTWAGHFGWIHPKDMEQDGSVPEAWHWEWIGDGGKMFLGEYFGIGNAPLSVPRGLPFGSVDSIAPVPGGVSVAGWAIDPDQSAPTSVHVYIDTSSYALTADRSRPDVAAAYPLYAAAQHGYSAMFPTPVGSHDVCVYAINASGTGYNIVLRCEKVTVTQAALPSTPTAQASAPTAPATSSTTSTSPPAPAPTTTVAGTVSTSPSTATTTPSAQAAGSTTR